MPVQYSWAAFAGATASAVSGTFPLSVNAGGRFLQSPDGTPFLVLGDTPWCLPNNCTNAQIDSYLTDRAAKGCSAILFEIDKAYGNQTPTYRNTDGNDPFTVMSPVNWVINNAYWTRVDYIVDQAKAKGMVCFLAPAYTGYGSGSDGWLGDYSGVSDATLQTYGAALANRYTQGNVVWVMGGDDANDTQALGAYGAATPQRTKQWQIVLGIRSVRTTDLVTGHTARNTSGGGPTDGEAWLAWNNGFTGFNLNNTYSTDGSADMPALASTAHGRAGPMPFFMIEAGYENTSTENTNSRVPACQSFLRGGLVGMFDGHDALWHFGNLAPNNVGTASVLSTYLAPSWGDYQRLGNLLRAYAWHLLEPKLDTSLVTTALGTGASAICPARASDGSFAMIFTNGVNFTVNMAALTPSSVRARWYSVSAGTYTAAAGSPFANTGTQAVTAPGERILVLDAA